jgi:hypothetical protein
MAKVFDARRAIYVPATGGHPPNTEYRIAWGFEQWGNAVAVTKVQMVYNGRVAGMLSPSYPDNTFDEKAVVHALQLLKQGYGTGSKKSKLVFCLKKLEENQALDQLLDATEDEIHNMNLEIFTGSNGISPVVSIGHVETIELEGLFGFLFQVDIS